MMHILIITVSYDQETAFQKLSTVNVFALLNLLASILYAKPP